MHPINPTHWAFKYFYHKYERDIFMSPVNKLAVKNGSKIDVCHVEERAATAKTKKKKKVRHRKWCDGMSETDIYRREC